MKASRVIGVLFLAGAGALLATTGCSADEGLPREPVGEQQQALTCSCAGTTEVCPPDTACVAYSCVPCCGPNCTECTPTFNSGGCNDGDPCTINDTCDGNGTCKGVPNPCNDNNPCTVDSCNAAMGGCQHTPEPSTKACNDGNACTTGDHCSGIAPGACIGGGTLSCNDGKVCTADSCDPATGCKYTPLASGTACDDGNPCTVATKCDAAGNCGGGTPLNCDDGNPCTTDSCGASGCSYANNTNACSDGNSCTLNDTCSGGTCKPGTPQVCNDNNPCTKDSCVAGAGCVYVAEPNGTTCDDGNSCSTGDQCQNGACAGTGGLNCNDSNPCTKNTCVSGVCTYPNENNGTPCDDGNKCTQGDSCQNGTCGGTSLLNCDDNNPCTKDICDPTVGCKHEYNADPCSDNDPCTLDDKCENGSCKGGAPLTCTATDECHKAGTCNSATGQCSAETLQPDDTPCTGGKCKAGTCVLTGDGGVPDGGPDSGSGGAAGSGGTGGSGTGGGGGSTGGGAGSGGGTGGAEPTFTPDPQGCKCRVPSGRDATPGGWALAGLAALAFGARRRRARHREL